MTLTSAINAAREALNKAVTIRALSPHHEPWVVEICRLCCEAKSSLTALPDKPMTEDQILEIILRAGCHKSILRDLKAANVLYVSEEK